MRKTALRDALLWLLLAWAGWVTAGVAIMLGQPQAPWRHLALSLTCCYFIAALGARRPGVSAWNFVVLGLLAVLCLPFLEQSWHAAGWHLDEPRTLFLSVALGVGVLNYLPTRFTISTLLSGLALAAEVWQLTESGLQYRSTQYFGVAVLLHGAAAWLALRRSIHEANDSIERMWQRFRDAFGSVWALRVQEQFNAAVRHAKWPVTLRWHGMEYGNNADRTRPALAEIEQKLQAVLRPFLGA